MRTLQIAQEENYRDPSHIQQKHQKQQAFEAELAANSDRIATIINAGQNLIQNAKCQVRDCVEEGERWLC